MGQILHKRATTTQRIRKEIQDSTESIATLAKRYGTNPKTVIKGIESKIGIHDLACSKDTKT